MKDYIVSKLKKFFDKKKVRVAVYIILGYFFIQFIAGINAPKNSYTGLMKLYYNSIYSLTPCPKQYKKRVYSNISYEELDSVYHREYLITTNTDIIPAEEISRNIEKNFKDGRYFYEYVDTDYNITAKKEIHIDRKLIDEWNRINKITYNNFFYGLNNFQFHLYKITEKKTEKGYKFILVEPIETPKWKKAYFLLDNGDVFKVFCGYWWSEFKDEFFLKALFFEIVYSGAIHCLGPVCNHFLPLIKIIKSDKYSECEFNRILKTLEIKIQQGQSDKKMTVFADYHGIIA